MRIVKNAKNIFLAMINSFGSDPYRLLPHVQEAEIWAKFLIQKYPKADEEVVLLSIWLHDLGHYPVPTDVDHAIRSELRAKDFLEKENYDNNKIRETLHCVRSHRCLMLCQKH